MTHRAPIVTLVAVFALGFASLGRGQSEARLRLDPVVWIEAGVFLRGTTENEIVETLRECSARERSLGADLGCRRWLPTILAAEMPQQRVHLSAYGIDRYEVTRRQYQQCVRAGVCAPSRVSDARFGPDAPITGIDLAEAETYCAFAGGHVPTEAQWERAARGTDGRRYPWGWQFNPRLANLQGVLDGFRVSAPVGSFASVRSPTGLRDAAGNVWEWTRSAWHPEGYVLEGESEDVDAIVYETPGGGVPVTGRRATRGGGFQSHPHELRATFRLPRLVTDAGFDLGVRCAYRAR